jgi:uncharacterized membrane protein YeaQ/YmgE (transglycosylase-associated protein family)
MQIDFAALVVWLIVGGLGGYIAGMLIKMRQSGFGVVGNIVIGLVGALIGGFLFDFFNISVAGDVSISADDVIAAIVGSMILIIVLAFIRRK